MWKWSRARAQGYHKGQSGDKGGGNKEQREQIEAMPDRKWNPRQHEKRT
ncbi:hypothetical protein CK203_112193 [Vitis vinifera]|uniref:Uncharacterized protein n=1 Tax=Vitis vinifera TaxID=29760 RepID=A0A438CSK1_VITVI|nr:hypothetical protein CK203_112193 [Vitis vinifera]